MSRSVVPSYSVRCTPGPAAPARLRRRSGRVRRARCLVDGLRPLARVTVADELVITSVTHDFDHRLQSHELRRRSRTASRGAADPDAVGTQGFLRRY
ncbi:hypothetical protein CNO18_07425 [Gordonia sp. 1D]|nr:hypothetical protein CNO18_07425 [Gordonia sp. 1D]